MWQSIVFGIILIVLGLIEARETIHYAHYDSKHKEVVSGPLAVYSGAAFSILFVIFRLGLILGTTPSTHLNHLTYIIIGIVLIISSVLIFFRGRRISKSLQKNGETTFQAIQAYWISAVVLISGIVSLFR